MLLLVTLTVSGVSVSGMPQIGQRLKYVRRCPSSGTAIWPGKGYLHPRHGANGTAAGSSI